MNRTHRNVRRSPEGQSIFRGIRQSPGSGTRFGCTWREKIAEPFPVLRQIPVISHVVPSLLRGVHLKAKFFGDHAASMSRLPLLGATHRKGLSHSKTPPPKSPPRPAYLVTVRSQPEKHLNRDYIISSLASRSYSPWVKQAHPLALPANFGEPNSDAPKHQCVPQPSGLCLAASGHVRDTIEGGIGRHRIWRVTSKLLRFHLMISGPQSSAR